MEPVKYSFSKELVAHLIDMIQDGLLRGKDISEKLMNMKLVETNFYAGDRIELALATNEELQYSLDADVLARIVQILQEALVMGMDIAELLRAVCMTTATPFSSSSAQKLMLSTEYKDNIKREHENLVERAQERASGPGPLLITNEPTIIKL